MRVVITEDITLFIQRENQKPAFIARDPLTLRMSRKIVHRAG